MTSHLSIFVSLRMDVLDTFSLQRELDQIGRLDVAPAE